MHALHLRQTLADGSQVVTLLAIDDDRHADFLPRFRHLLAIATEGSADAAVNAVGHTRFLREAGKLARALDGGVAPALRQAGLGFDAVRAGDVIGGFNLGQDMQRMLALKANGLSI
jgi:hypothetical protein